MQFCISSRSVGSVFANSVPLATSSNIVTIDKKNLLYLTYLENNAFKTVQY